MRRKTIGHRLDTCLVKVSSWCNPHNRTRCSYRSHNLQTLTLHNKHIAIQVMHKQKYMDAHVFYTSFTSLRCSLVAHYMHDDMNKFLILFGLFFAFYHFRETIMFILVIYKIREYKLFKWVMQ